MTDVKTYLFEYYFDGAEYGFEIKAASKEEAERRVKVISFMSRYQGEVMATARVPAFFERLARAARVAYLGENNA